MLSKQRELPSFSHRGGKASPVRRSISYSVTPGDQPWLEALLSSVPEVSAQPNHTQALSCTNSLNKQYTFFIYFCRKRVRYFSGRTNYGTVVCVLTYINTQGYHFSGKYIKKKSLQVHKNQRSKVVLSLSHACLREKLFSKQTDCHPPAANSHEPQDGRRDQRGDIQCLRFRADSSAISMCSVTASQPARRRAARGRQDLLTSTVRYVEG